MTVMWNYWFSKKDFIYRATDSFFGIVSSFMIVVVWIPQLYTTFKAKRPGSLSIMMLALTAPGGYLAIIFVAVIYSNGIWVWIPTVFSAAFQTVLLFMCIYYEYGWKIRTFCCTESEENRYTAINQSSADITVFKG